MENIQSELYLYTIRQKTSVKRGGTNPKAKNYKSVSKSIFWNSATTNNVRFCSTKDNVGSDFKKF